MKNIHIIPTDKPTGIFKSGDNLLYSIMNKVRTTNEGFHIYITSDEEIKEGDWIFNEEREPSVLQCIGQGSLRGWNKIILTTDQDLIKDGVQGIDDEFLEWFVKNPSCEEVEIKKDEFYCKNDFINGKDAITYNYKIIIPKEELTVSDEAKQRAKNYMFLKSALEPKQETLEEAMRRNGYHDEVNDTLWREGVKFGAKWQQERMYSEEEVHKILCKSHNAESTSIIANTLKKWFEQFKKK